MGVSSGESSVLEWFVDPLSSAQFLNEYFGRKYGIFKGPSDRFKSTLSFNDLDEVFGTYGLRFPEVQVVRSDEDIPVDSYTTKNHLIDTVRAARLFHDGATLIFTALHDRHERVRQLCTRFALEATARTQANIYLTPPNSQGFKPHWDSHDVFILQVEGTKRWQIFENGVEQPVPPDKFNPKDFETGDVTDEFVIEEGDVLYIPRGVTHAGVSTDTLSLHITLGMIAYTWTDLITDSILELSERDPEMRKHVPFGFGRSDSAGRKELDERWPQALSDVTSRIEPDAVIKARLDDFNAAHRPRVTDGLRQALESSEITPEDLVCWRSILPARVEDRGERIAIVCAGREVEFPAPAAPTVEALVQGRELRAGEIDDNLDWDTRKTVLSTLRKEGMIARLDDGS
jgi:ribosomal protein L16 Arg81 hydroxylase